MDSSQLSETEQREQFSQIITTNQVGDPLRTEYLGMSPNRAMTIPAFFSGIRFGAETMASLPLDVYQKSGGIRKPVDNHPAEVVWNLEINNLTTPAVAKETFYGHVDPWGNGYFLIDRTGPKLSLYNLPPDSVMPLRYTDAEGQWQQAYAISYEGKWETVDPYYIFHLPGYGFDGLRGYSVVELMAQTLEAGKNAEAFGSTLFKNGGQLGLVLEIPTGVKLTPDQIENLRSQLRERHTGTGNAHRPIILPAGMTAKQLTISPENAQFLQTRQFNTLDIARMLRYPPHIFYELDRATWNNIQWMGIELIKYSFGARIIKTEQEINRKLLSSDDRQNGFYVKLNVDALQRGDPGQRIDSATKRLASGISTINEERALEDLAPVGPIGDIIRVASNQQVASDQPPASNSPPQVKPPTVETATAKPPVTLQSFGAVIGEAATRVGRKTAKATENAQGKHEGQAWTIWGNTFATEAEQHAKEAVAPILHTFAAVAGHELAPELAGRIGQRYGQALRQHFAKLARSEPTELPDLEAITLHTAAEEAHEA